MLAECSGEFRQILPDGGLDSREAALDRPMVSTRPVTASCSALDLGLAKEGGRHHGYTGARGYHPLLASGTRWRILARDRFWDSRESGNGGTQGLGPAGN